MSTTMVVGARDLRRGTNADATVIGAAEADKHASINCPCAAHRSRTRKSSQGSCSGYRRALPQNFRWSCTATCALTPSAGSCTRGRPDIAPCTRLPGSFWMSKRLLHSTVIPLNVRASRPNHSRDGCHHIALTAEHRAPKLSHIKQCDQSVSTARSSRLQHPVEHSPLGIPLIPVREEHLSEGIVGVEMAAPWQWNAFVPLAPGS